jgi:hypothetical protein
MHEGALPFEYLRHEGTQGPGADENQPQEDRDL